MSPELEKYIDEMIDDMEDVELDIDNIINYRLAEEIIKHCGIEE